MNLGCHDQAVVSGQRLATSHDDPEREVRGSTPRLPAEEADRLGCLRSTWQLRRGPQGVPTEGGSDHRAASPCVNRSSPRPGAEDHSQMNWGSHGSHRVSPQPTETGTSPGPGRRPCGCGSCGRLRCDCNLLIARDLPSPTAATSASPAAVSPSPEPSAPTPGPSAAIVTTPGVTSNWTASRGASFL